MTGLGDALGVLVGQAILSSILAYWEWKGCLDMIGVGAVLMCGSFLSGTVWQPLVNAFATADLGFSAAAALTGLCCGSSFFVGMLLGIKLIGKITDWSILMVATLAATIGGATALFVGTDVQFSGNWLGNAVGERQGDNKFVDCLRAAFSTTLGFFMVQLILNAVVPLGSLWTDDPLQADAARVGSSRDYGSVNQEDGLADSSQEDGLSISAVEGIMIETGGNGLSLGRRKSVPNF